MTLTSDVIEQTRLLLYADTRPERNKLNAAINTSVTSFTFRYSQPVARQGQTVGVNLEEMHVWQDSGQTVTVQRADAGSTAASHSEGDVVWIGRFTPWRILTAINDELRGLSSHRLFRVRTASLNWDAQGEYSLASLTDFLDVVDVQEDPTTVDYPRTVRRGDWRLQRGTNSGVNTLAVLDSIMPSSAVVVTYKSKFGTLSSLSQNVLTQTGLWDEAHDILSLGAAIRLLSGWEAARNTGAQGDTRRGDEVPPGARTNSLRPLMARYQERLNDEALRQRAQYPEQVR